MAFDTGDDHLGNRENEDFVEHLGGNLTNHHGKDGLESHGPKHNGNEDEGVGTFTHKGGNDGTEPEDFALLEHFHATEDPCVEG